MECRCTNEEPEQEPQGVAEVPVTSVVPIPNLLVAMETQVIMGMFQDNALQDCWVWKSCSWRPSWSPVMGLVIASMSMMIL